MKSKIIADLFQHLKSSTVNKGEDENALKSTPALFLFFKCCSFKCFSLSLLVLARPPPSASSGVAVAALAKQAIR